MNKIILYIDLEHASELAMDLQDAAPESNAKIKEDDETKDWHLILADSIKDQAERISKECKCTDCKCGKGEFVLPELKMEPSVENITNPYTIPYTIQFKNDPSDIVGTQDYLSGNTQPTK